MSQLSRLHSPAAVQAALDEYSKLGRSAFLERYGFGKSRDYLVLNPRTGELCDSKAIVGVAYSHEHPDEGPLTPDQFSVNYPPGSPRFHPQLRVVKVRSALTVGT